MSLAEMEEKIVAVTEYTNFCALNYDFNANAPVCVRQDSVVNYFDPSERLLRRFIGYIRWSIA